MVSRNVADDFGVINPASTPSTSASESCLDVLAGLAGFRGFGAGDLAMIFSPCNLGLRRPGLVFALTARVVLDADNPGSLKMDSSEVRACLGRPEFMVGIEDLPLTVCEEYFGAEDRVLSVAAAATDADMVFCEGFAILEVPPRKKTFGGVYRDPGDGTAGICCSFVGDDRPGGRKGCLTEEAGLSLNGVADREVRILEAGR